MVDPLLSYSISTVPLPLQINATSASVTIVASNPGYYSDKPDTNYVAPTQVVLAFGDLLTSDPSSIAASAIYTPSHGAPVSWAPPQRTGAQFTFNAPTGTKIFPGDSLSFVFAKITVGGAVASVALNLTETASSPGDPSYPGGYYPPQPSQARLSSRQIGVFPVNFTISAFTSSPSAVNPGQPAQLSWNASAQANTSFALVYAVNGAVHTVSEHVDGTPLQAIDTYPNSSHDGGLVLSISRTTTFSLLATYTAGTVITAEKQVTVNVPDPTITLFQAAPATGLLVANPVQMQWATLAADYVTIDPALDGANPIVPNTGSATIYPLEYTRYTLTASGRGLNVRQSLVLFPLAPGWTTVRAKSPWQAGLAPLFVAVNGQLWVLPDNPNSSSNALYSSPDGQAWILANPNLPLPLRRNAASLSDPTNQKAWIMGGVGANGAMNDVWKTSDGRTWTSASANPAWTARSDFGCVYFNNLYWVMGGVDGGGNLLNDIWSSADGANWKNVSSNPAWSARSTFGLTVFAGQLWIFGGKTASGVSNDLWSSTDGVNWQSASNPFGGNQPSARTNCQLFATASYLFAIGGLDANGNGLSDTWACTSSGDWTATSGPPFPSGSKYFGATSYNGGFWFAGGASDSALAGGVWVLAPIS